MLEPIYEAFHDPTTKSFRVVAVFVNVLILISIALLFLELGTDDYDTLLGQIDQGILAVFVIEIALRVLTWRPHELRLFEYPLHAKLRVHLLGRLRFLLQPLNLIDLITILALLPWLRAFRALRLLRLLRSMDFLRISRSIQGIDRSFRDDRILFISAFSILIGGTIVGGLTLYLVEANVNPSINSVDDGLWWALVTLTTVGFGDITPITGPGRIIGGVLMITGMFMLALFAGIISQTILQNVLRIREEQFRMSDYLDHLIICGYDPGVELLFEAILAEKKLVNSTKVVVFAPGERPKDIPESFVWVPGDPTKESELDKVRLVYASAVIIVGSRNCDPQDADAKTILTAFTIRAHLSKQTINTQRKQPVYVVAEILASENVNHARTAGANEVIETTRLGFTLIAHAVRMPGTADVIAEVAAANDTSLYVGKLFPQGNDNMLGFTELARRIKHEHDVLVIGIRSADGEEIINPTGDTMVLRGTDVIYIGGTAVEP